MNSERLIQIISDITGIPAEEMGEDTLLFEELGVDSLEMFKIYTEVSAELDAAFDIKSFMSALSIGKLLTIINDNRLG
ncbi:MAG: acyl carrier protein [Lachnospiraceae bacterium]|nr:acyl carrier protein [Lachnospiraceae bacterium]